MSGNKIPTSESFRKIEAYNDTIKKQEEAHFFGTIRDFERLLYQDGAEKVLANLDEEAYWILRNALKG